MPISKTFLSGFAAVAVITTYAPAQAALITPTGVTASSTFNGSTAATKMIDGSGLTGTDETATHDNNGGGGGFTMYHSAVGTTSNVTLDFDLGGAFDLDGALIWQFNQANLSDRGVQTFDLFTSTDGVNYTDQGEFSLTQEAGTGSISAQTVAFNATGVTDVRFVLLDNYGGVVIGLAEVRFSEVPEPGSLALLGLGGLAVLRRRRQSPV